VIELGDLTDHSEVRWVPVATAMRALGVSKQMVHKLIKYRQLIAQVLDGTVLIKLSSINDRRAAMELRRRNQIANG
jgi:hypothetical protein